MGEVHGMLKFLKTPGLKRKPVTVRPLYHGHLDDTLKWLLREVERGEL